MDSLETIIQQATEGKSEAFQTIVQKFQDMAVGYAFSILGDFHLAEDAAQEAFLTAYLSLQQLQKPAAFPGWFRRIVFTSCGRFTRGKQPDLISLEDTTEVTSHRPGPFEEAEAREMNGIVRKAIQDLPEHVRQVTTLYYISDYSQKEISAFLGVPVSTVKKRLYDARSQLKEGMLKMVHEEIQNNAPSGDNTFVRRLEEAIQGNDIQQLKKLIEKNPDAVNRGHEWVKLQFRNHPLAYATRLGRIDVMKTLLEAGAEVNVDTPYGNPMVRAMGRGDIAAMDLLYEHGAKFDPNTSLMIGCEVQRPTTIKWLLDKGADPNFYHRGWDCTVLMALAQTYTRRDTLGECVNLLIDAGAEYDDGPIMDILRDKPDLLEARISENPEVVHQEFEFDYGDHLTLRGSTLLHIAVEYNVQSCVDILLKHGADPNARVRIGNNGVGGQTPIFHVIGSNQGRCYSMFEYLLEKKADLNVKAKIQNNMEKDGKIMDCMHKGQDHHFDEVLELTPLGYALKYEHEPEWRNAAREVVKLRELGAPEK